MKGKVWRIGLMGESSRRANVLALLAALEDVLASEGRALTRGTAVARLRGLRGASSPW